jgi:hypothetical protein
MEGETGSLGVRAQRRPWAIPSRIIIFAWCFGDSKGSRAAIPAQSEREVMSDNPEVEDERPCLHCLIGDLIDEYYGEYGSPGGEADVIDVSEIMTSLAKIVAEITSGSDKAEGRRIVEELSREIAKYDAEYREHAASGASGFDVRH